MELKQCNCVINYHISKGSARLRCRPDHERGNPQVDVDSRTGLIEYTIDVRNALSTSMDRHTNDTM